MNDGADKITIPERKSGIVIFARPHKRKIDFSSHDRALSAFIAFENVEDVRFSDESIQNMDGWRHAAQIC